MNGHQSHERVIQLAVRYPLRVALLRVGIGIWLLVLTGIFYGSSYGRPWAWLLATVAVVHFGLAYRLIRIARTDPERRVRVP